MLHAGADSVCVRLVVSTELQQPQQTSQQAACSVEQEVADVLAGMLQRLSQLDSSSSHAALSCCGPRTEEAEASVVSEDKLTGELQTCGRFVKLTFPATSLATALEHSSSSSTQQLLPVFARGRDSPRLSCTRCCRRGSGNGPCAALGRVSSSREWQAACVRALAAVPHFFLRISAFVQTSAPVKVQNLVLLKRASAQVRLWRRPLRSYRLHQQQAGAAGSVCACPGRCTSSAHVTASRRLCCSTPPRRAFCVLAHGCQEAGLQLLHCASADL